MSSGSQPWIWQPTSAPNAGRYDDIWFISELVGWAVNSNGNILMTTDGGENWVIQLRNGPYLRCIGFASPQIGWVGALSNTRQLFHTSNGGDNWTLVNNLPADSPPRICGISVVNESVVFASGTNYPNLPARMMKTTDGGGTWTAWEMGQHAALLVDTYFTSPDHGWVVGGKTDDNNPNPPNRSTVKPVVLRTEDGGATWENRAASIHDSLPEGEWGWKIQFLNDQIGFVSLENFSAGAILKTTDGGETWERKPINDQQGNINLEGIGFVDEDLGWVGGWSKSSETRDGGNNWTDANEIGQFINRFRFLGNPVSGGYSSGVTVYKMLPQAVPDVRAAPSNSILKTSDPGEFRGEAYVEFTVPAGASRLTIDIWDHFGAHVRTLADEKDPVAGDRSIAWKGEDDDGAILTPGNFIYRVTIDDSAESRIVRLT